MATRTNKRTGEVQEMRDGQWVTIQPGMSLPQMSVQTRPADPTIGSKTRQAANQAAASDYAPGTASAEQRIKEAEAANARSVADAQARKAEADARIAEANANSGNAKAATTVRADAIKDYQTSQQLYGIIADLNQKYASGPGATSGVSGARDYLPLTVNQQFDKAGNAARGVVGQALGFTGGQLNTQREAEQAVGPYLPQADDRDEVIKDKIARLTELAKTAEQRSISTLGGRPDPNGNIVPIGGQPEAPSAPPPGSGDQMKLNGGNRTRSEVDPALQAVGKRVGGMISRGASESDIRDFLSKNGVNPANTSIGDVLKFRASPDFQKWQRANPGKAYPIGPEFYTKEVPMSQLRQDLNKGAASGAGGAIDSYLAAAANSVSGNRLDGLTDMAGGNGGMTNTGLALLRQEHPMASLAGDASGQAMFDLAASRIPGLGGGTLAPTMARDAIYGGYAGQGDGNTLGGIATNVGGGLLGRGVSKVGGGLLRGVSSKSADYLNRADVPLTIGSIGRGVNTPVGNGIAWTEDRLAGLPVADAIINGARRRGEEGFNRAAFREAGGSGLIGAQGVGELGNKVDNAYSFLDTTNLPHDAPFAGSQAGVRANLPNLPAFGNEVGKGMDLIDRASPGGVLPGRDWQSAIRDTRANRSSLAGQPFAQKATESLSDVESNLLGLASRQGPAGTVDALNAANKQYGQYQTILGALDNGPAQARGELFSPTRLDTASRQGAKAYGGRAASMAGDRPFYDLTTAGMDVMPNQIPDSGTAGRSLFYAALPSILGGGAGAAYGAASDNTSVGEGAASGALLGTVLPTAALATLYSKPVQKGIQKMLLGPRGKGAQKAADIVGSTATQKALGPAVSSLLRRMYFYSPLEQ